MSPLKFTYTAVQQTPLCQDLLPFKLTDQDSKQVAREAREAIHMRIHNPGLSQNTGKMNILEIFNCLLGPDS